MEYSVMIKEYVVVPKTNIVMVTLSVNLIGRNIEIDGIPIQESSLSESATLHGRSDWNENDLILLVKKYFQLLSETVSI